MPGGSNYQGSREKLAQYTAVVERSESDAEVRGAKNPYTSPKRAHVQLPRP